MSLPKTVKIREVGPREGFQTHPEVVPTERKLELIALLNATGVKDIEITSFVKVDRLPQMADAEELAARFEMKKDIRYTALYLNVKGFERAERSGRFSNQGWLQFAVSETFFKRNSNRTHEQALAEFPEWLAEFARHSKKLHGLMLSTAFGCNYEGVVSEATLRRILTTVREKMSSLDQKFSEICLADTVGLGDPDSVKRGIAVAREIFPSAEISLHLHDTRGTAMANAYSGLLEGVSTFDASVGGLGGCPFTKGAAGNIVSEDLAYLCASLGIATGLSLADYARAAKFAEQLIGRALPGKYYKSISGL